MSRIYPKVAQNNQVNPHEVQQISTFRRILPQFLAISTKNIIVFNMGQVNSIASIVIPSLIGLNTNLNPNETVHVTASETSWLSSCIHIAHPFGSLLSGPLCDSIGRRKAMMLIGVPFFVAWVMLGFTKSFPIICLGFMLLGFCMGLKDAPTKTYVSEISEPSFRGTFASITFMTYNIGVFTVFGLGAFLSWRQVSISCALFPICFLIAVLFVPESPFWLFSKDRPKDAQKSLQWLRGWVSPQTVHTEFTNLQTFSYVSNACLNCSKQSIKCNHPKATIWDKIKELKRKRNLKPFILGAILYFFEQFNLCAIWQPYIVQVLVALGTPIDASTVTVLNASIGTASCIILMLIIKKLGRRKIYLTSAMCVVICSFALSAYGFVFFPSGWTSFEKHPLHIHESIKEKVGNYSYIALAIVLLMQFTSKFAVNGFASLFTAEIFPFKSRSLLCGISTAVNYFFASIATKTYYNVEVLFSLPGACLIYGIITFIGLFVMFFIMPETEQRSLEDIEIHFSDNSKGLTDIHIRQHSESVQCRT